MLKGYRTIIVNIVGLAVAILASQGIDVTPEDQASIVTAILAVINIAMRFITTTPVGKSE